MWTLSTRTKLVRPVQPDATCLTDTEWQIAPAFLLPRRPAAD